MKKRSKFYIRIIIVVLLALASVFLKLIADSVKEKKYYAEKYSAANKTEVYMFLRSQGLAVQEQGSEAIITIPFRFNEVYNSYNSIQISQGFDLSKHKGEEAVLYRFEIIDASNAEYAAVLASENTIIGASIQSDRNEGCIKPLIIKNNKQ